MNTQLYIWIEPLVVNHKQCSDRLYINYVTNDSNVPTDLGEATEYIFQSKIIEDILYYANVPLNNDAGVISITPTKKEVGISFTKSPDEKKKEKLANKKALQVKNTEKAILSNKKEITLTKKSIKILDNGVLKINVPELDRTDYIDFDKIWNLIEDKFIGKLKPQEKIELINNNGDTIIEIQEGSFLNIAGGDLLIYDPEKRKNETHHTLINRGVGLKGGLFVREDGSLDIADAKRTFYLKIYTDKLVKTSLLTGESLEELTGQKLLK